MLQKQFGLDQTKEVDLSVLRNFDFVGLSPGTIITNNNGPGLLKPYTKQILVPTMMF